MINRDICMRCWSEWLGCSISQIGVDPIYKDIARVRVYRNGHKSMACVVGGVVILSPNGKLPKDCKFVLEQTVSGG